IFPQPQELQILEGRLPLGDQSFIAVPVSASQGDLLLARFLTEELTDRWGSTVVIRRVTTIPANRSVILMGSMANPLVKAYCARHNIAPIRDKSSGYVLQVTDNVALVAGADEDGAFYGLQSLRQLIERDGNAVAIRNVGVRNWPDKAFRGIRIYLPG